MGHRDGWLLEGHEVLGRLCEGFFAGGSMGHGYVVCKDGPLGGGEEGVCDGVVVVDGGEKGLESMGFRGGQKRHGARTSVETDEGNDLM